MNLGIMCHSGFGGSVRIVTKLAEILSGRGHRIHMFTRTSPPRNWVRKERVILHILRPETENEHHPSALFTNWSQNDLEAMTSHVCKVIANHEIEILHCHYAVPFAFVARDIKQRLGQLAPFLIVTLHGTDVTIHGRDTSKVDDICEALSHLNAITSVSKNHSDLAANVLGLSTQPQVIYNFVDLSDFNLSNIPYKWQPGDSQRPKIAYISNFRQVKDAKSMAMLFLGIRKKIAAELWLIGEGEELGEIQAILGESCFAKDIRYFGLQTHVAPILRHIDLLMVTSLYESFSLASLEAMACGVPVVAPRVGGIPEVVLHGQTGLLFREGDLNAAVRYAVDLLSDKELHQAMSRSAIRRAEQFHSEIIVSEYEKLYESLISGWR